MSNPEQALTPIRRGPRTGVVGIALVLAALLAATAHLLRAAEPLKVAGLPVT